MTLLHLRPWAAAAGGLARAAKSIRKLSKVVDGMARALDCVSEAASSTSKVCRALLLTHETVLAAIDAAEEGGGARR